MYNEIYKKAKPFVYRNARPLDFARWQYHFENGSKQGVLSMLAQYQNEDGGFGHALEPDMWNPNSSPIQTWCATNMLKEISLDDRNHPIIKGIVKYLSSGADFNGANWYRTIPSNDAYPHAPWWKCDENYNTTIYYNPTASLAGFLLRFTEIDAPIYQTALKIANAAIAQFLLENTTEMHLLRCYVELRDYIQAADIKGIEHFSEFTEKIINDIAMTIEKDSEKWMATYCCKPSFFTSSQGSNYYAGCEQLCKEEIQQIFASQQENGAWKVTWSWEGFDSEFAISANWWQTNMILESLLFVRTFQ